jgi:iron complex outermembrane recepter protein
LGAQEVPADAAAPPPAAEAPVPAPAEAKHRGVEEIVVTAQKREASIQEVPISMSAVSGEDATFRGIRGVSDLQFAVPNLNYSEREGGATVAIRGVGLNVEFGSVESAVAAHIDGHYQGKISTGILGLNDVDRIEVLRGPQGTLYGRNATGGAINFILKKPTDEFEGHVRFGYGSFDTLNLFGVVSGPIIENVLNARAYAEYDQTDGFIENLTLDRTVGDRDGYGGRVALSYFPLENVTADLSILSRLDHSAPVEVMRTPPRPDLEARLTIIPSSPDTYTLGNVHEVKEQRRERGQRDTQDATATIAWESPWATVKSISGAQYHYLMHQYDNDAQSRPTFYLKQRRDRSITVTQEVNISNSLDLPWGMKLDWLVGAFYYKDDYHIFIPVDLLEAALGADLFVFAAGEEETNAYAGFGDATLWLLDWVRVFGGIRQSFEDKTLFQNVRAFGPGHIPIENLPEAIQDAAQLSLCNDVTLETSFDNFSPRYGVQVDAWDGIMVYGQHSLGFKAGGANPFACNNIYDPEEVDSWEVGVKTTWLDGSVTANFAWFTNDYTDFQVLKTQGLEGPVVNAKAASIDGVELEVRAQPFGYVTELLAPLSLDVGASWLDARYDDFMDVDPGDPGLPGFPKVQDLAGHQMNRAPDYRLNAGVEYQWKVPVEMLGNLRARLEYFKTDDVVFRPYGRADDKQPGYSLWNTYLSLTNAADDIEVRFFGKNLGDEEYFAMIAAQQLGTHYGEPGAPRAFGGEVTLRF